MAPTTRSSRLRASSTQENILANLDGRAPNTDGFLTLPDELHLEVLSHLPAVPVPTHGYKVDDIEGINTRHATLLALSQTCRALRRIFLQILWRRIEVFDGMQTPKGPLPTTDLRLRTSPKHVRLRLYAEELVRQLEIVTIREPGLAQFVQVVNVLITSYSALAVLRELAKAFSRFPNLHTVQMDLVSRDRIPRFRNLHTVQMNLASNTKPSSGQQMISRAFKKYQYPQIRTLSLTGVTYIFASHCPKVRVIVPYLTPYFYNYPTNCPNLEVLGNMSLLRKIDEIATHLSNLRDITVAAGSPIDFSTQVEALRALPHLQTIRLRFDANDDERLYYRGEKRPVMDENEVIKRIEYARTILSERAAAGPQFSMKVVVTYESGRIEVIGI